MKEFTIRKYKDGDEIEINDLFNEVFNEKRSLEEWFWKFKKSSVANVSLITVAESNGKIVGQYTTMPYLMQYKNKTLMTVFAVDNLVHPKFRGGMKGMQWDMVEHSIKVFHENDISFGFGFPNREAYIVGKRILKYKDVGQIRVLFKRLNWNLAVRKRFSWLPNFMLKMIRYISSIGFKIVIHVKYRNKLKDIKIRKVESFDERFDAFWDEVKNQYNIIMVRDQRYLNWRYSKPGCKYQIFTAESSNKVVGYIVANIIKNDKETVGHIVDILTDNTKGVDSALIRRALLELVSNKVDYALCWMLPDKKVYTLLRGFGFSERDAFPAINVVCRVFNFERVDETDIKEPKNWYLTMGDSDVF